MRESLRETARALSGLTTRGRCLLAAGVAAAACAWILNERELLRVATFVLALPLLTVLFLSLAKVRIHAVRRLLPDRMQAGSHAEVELDLWRTGRLPMGQVVLEDRVPPVLGSRPRFVVERLPHQQAVAVSYPLAATTRGIHRIAGLRATTFDPFGLCELDHTLAGPSSLTVLPYTEALDGLPFGGSSGPDDWGRAGKASGAGDPDATVRHYRHGDDIRKVHWPLTARRDELVVRLEEQSRNGSTTILLDHRESAHAGTGPTASLEWAISFVASACLHLARSSHGARLVTGHGRPLAQVPPDGSVEHENAFLDSLTRLDGSHERDVLLPTDSAGATALLAVLGCIGEETAKRLALQRQAGYAGIAVLLDTARWSGGTAEGTSTAAEASASLLRSAGWSVVVVEPHATIAGVWSQLCLTNTHESPVAGPS